MKTSAKVRNIFKKSKNKFGGVKYLSYTCSVNKIKKSVRLKQETVAIIKRKIIDSKKNKTKKQLNFSTAIDSLICK